MVELKRLGMVRLEYLDLANKYFAEGDYAKCEGYIENFFSTISEGSDGGKKIAEMKKKLIDERNAKLEEHGNRAKMLDELDQGDFMDMKVGQTYVEYLKTLKADCWNISLGEGLFDA